MQFLETFLSMMRKCCEFFSCYRFNLRKKSIGCIFAFRLPYWLFNIRRSSWMDSRNLNVFKPVPRCLFTFLPFFRYLLISCNRMYPSIYTVRSICAQLAFIWGFAFAVMVSKHFREKEQRKKNYQPSFEMGKKWILCQKNDFI